MTGVPPSADQIEQLIAFFLPYCRDQSTLKKLRDIAPTPDKWCDAYAVFDMVRIKTLRAIDESDTRLQWQYSFEEICAKTLYNMTGVTEPVPMGIPAPFDDDSPEHVGPISLSFAEYLGLDIPAFLLSLVSSGQSDNAV